MQKKRKNFEDVFCFVLKGSYIHHNNIPLEAPIS